VPLVEDPESFPAGNPFSSLRGKRHVFGGGNPATFKFVIDSKRTLMRPFTRIS